MTTTYRWTRERPTVPGYYWRLEFARPGCPERAEIVRVIDWGDGVLCVGVAEAHDWDGEWAGPIPQPERGSDERE